MEDKMQSLLIIPPNSLSQKIKLLSRYSCIIMMEDTYYFRPNCNKIKLAYLRACMKFYAGYNKQHNIQYYDYDNISAAYSIIKSAKQVYCADPQDIPYIQILRKLNKSLIILESDQFLADDVVLAGFYDKSKYKKQLSNGQFFSYMKQQLGILQGVPNYDCDNRNAIPKNITLPDNLEFQSEWHKEAIHYIDTHSVFKRNVGKTSNVQCYPVTYSQAKQQLNYFIRHKLCHFGDYQDAVIGSEVFLYHSNISCALNVGLISPKYVVKQIMKIAKQVRINNVEGFIRQVVGWREYMRYIYKYHYDELIVANHWKLSRQITHWRPWYEGSTGIQQLDIEIKKCAGYAYSHHIVRLMCFLNIFILLEIHPRSIVEWFKDVCAIDAYDWVMVSNIYVMGWFSTRFMKKPYIATGGYLQKMSGQSVSRQDPLWNQLFHAFLQKHNQQFTGSAQIYRRNMRQIYVDEKQLRQFVKHLQLQKK